MDSTVLLMLIGSFFMGAAFGMVVMRILVQSVWAEKNKAVRERDRIALLLYDLREKVPFR